MPSFKLTVAYDGTGFAGWQWQLKHRTVQATLEQLLQRITGNFVRVTGSSRTDAGVHALGQVVNFTVDTHLPPATLRRAINAYAPKDLVVLDADYTTVNFHATRDAVAKRYRYVVQDGSSFNVFQRNFAWRVWQQLDVDAMEAAAKFLVGTHDFSAFQTSGSKRVTTTRTIQELIVCRPKLDVPLPELEQGRAGEAATLAGSLSPFDRAGQVWIEVQADGFLYNMVRNIAGTLVSVGKRRQSVEWVQTVLASRDRKQAGMTAPAQGLYLLWARYPQPNTLD